MLDAVRGRGAHSLCGRFFCLGVMWVDGLFLRSGAKRFPKVGSNPDRTSQRLHAERQAHVLSKVRWISVL